MNLLTPVPLSTRYSHFGNTRIGRILVVDDSADNSFLLQAILEEEGYKVEVADNGFEALIKIEAAPPDLLLLDVMMPGMDGYEVTRRIRQNTTLPFIPILLITAYAQPSVVEGLDMGADDFIRKPIEFEELLARVRSLLRLKYSVDERDQIAREREDFVSRLTHDLRTPLVAADRMLTLFQQGALGELSAEMQEAIATMARSNQNLLDMVGTLLEVYRYEAGRKNLSFIPVDLVVLIQEVMEELRPLAKDRNIEMQFDCEQDTMEIMGDRLELRRTIMNLLGNAIKFTDRGGIFVRLKARNSEAEPLPDGKVVLEVEDTGLGIASEERLTIFERFRQGSNRRSGSGLGLYLSRRILEAHSGTIEVKSELGQGSTFTVCLPRRQDGTQ